MEEVLGGNYSWLPEAASGFVGRLLLRPTLSIFLNSARLTPALKQNPVVRRTERLGLGPGTWGPYDAHHNTFVPFETGKHQFRSLVVFSRALSSLIRCSHAFLYADTNPERVTALALGDCLGDSAELMLLSSRYGGGVRRSLIGLNLLEAAYYLRILILQRNANFAASVQTMAVSSIFPLWYFMFTRNNPAMRHYSKLTYLLLVVYCAPKLVILIKQLLTPKSKMSAVEEWDTKLSLAAGAAVALRLLWRIRYTFKHAVAQ